jgi:hypothetical protein
MKNTVTVCAWLVVGLQIHAQSLIIYCVCRTVTDQKNSFTRVDLSGRTSVSQQMFLPLPTFRQLRKCLAPSLQPSTRSWQWVNANHVTSVDLMKTEILIEAVDVKTCARFDEYLTDGTKGAVLPHFRTGLHGERESVKAKLDCTFLQSNPSTPCSSTTPKRKAKQARKVSGPRHTYCATLEATAIVKSFSEPCTNYPHLPYRHHRLHLSALKATSLTSWTAILLTSTAHLSNVARYW